MINGNVQEFIDGLHYGDELFSSTAETNILYKAIWKTKHRRWSFMCWNRLTAVLNGVPIQMIETIPFQSLSAQKSLTGNLFGKLKKTSNG